MNEAARSLVAMRKRYTISCAHCGLSVVKRDSRALYCSDRCRQAAGRKRIKEIKMNSKCHDGQGRITDHGARGWLCGPTGTRIVTVCEHHAYEIIAEYRDKLGEEWIFENVGTSAEVPTDN